jgi:hypothetical protein
MKKYTVSVIANVTIDLIVECEDDAKVKDIIESMSYEQLIDEGFIRIYSTEEILDDDIEPFIEEYFDGTL